MPAGVEEFLPRGRLAVLYFCLYLALAAVVMRAVAYYFFEDVQVLGGSTTVPGYDSRWVAMALLVSFTALALARHFSFSRLRRFGHVYLAIQTAIVFSLRFCQNSEREQGSIV